MKCYLTKVGEDVSPFIQVSYSQLLFLPLSHYLSSLFSSFFISLSLSLSLSLSTFLSLPLSPLLSLTLSHYLSCLSFFLSLSLYVSLSLSLSLFLLFRLAISPFRHFYLRFAQLAAANKDKIRQMLARLLLILYTPRLNKTLFFNVLSTISSPSPLTIIPLLAKGTDKFLQRFMLLYYMVYVAMRPAEIFEQIKLLLVFRLH